MAIQFEDINNNLRHITISGRLDILGTDEISTKFAALSCIDNKKVIVDLSAVSFLASIGIRSIITNAKTLKQRGGRMVLFVGDNAAVSNTLTMTGVEALIPMFADFVEASEAVLA
jgi:anti-anti-sigma factor